MKSKLVEDWLTKATERGGIDLALGQWLISQGQEVLWLGHSRTEFGKDIISVDTDGAFHAYQIKDENINLPELRKIRAQLQELVEVPIVHPRVPAGSPHCAHLVTSGLVNEVAAAQIRALNEGWALKGMPTIKVTDRNSLIPHFVAMSADFWPEKPADIREFFSFYLSDGRGDFDPRMFGSLMMGFVSLKDESKRRRIQRLAAAALLGNYLLNAFERQSDHWSAFRGWIMIAAHQAWFANRSRLPQKDWRNAFNLSLKAAKQCLALLTSECLQADGFRPQGIEFDDYTRTRNLILGSVLAVSGLVGINLPSDQNAQRIARLKMLIEETRLFVWGESAVPHVLAIQWFLESQHLPLSAIPLVEESVVALCDRNDHDSNDIVFAPPRVSPDEVLANLFSADVPSERSRRSRDSWSLEALLYFLVRRNDRQFLANHWRAISRLNIISFLPNPIDDALLWDAPAGHEEVRRVEREQSWTKLRELALEDRALPQTLRENPEFALMFLLTYPHRISPGLVGFLDQNFGNLGGFICALGSQNHESP